MCVIGDQPGACIFTQDGVLGTNRIGGSSSQGKNAKAVSRMITTFRPILCPKWVTSGSDEN